FLGQLKVASKDAGLVPFRLLGSQRYMIDEIARGLGEGISTFYCLKSRQVGSTTLCLALDMFWAFEHKGLLGTFVLHKEEARDDWRQTIDVFYHEIPARAEIGGDLVKFRPGLERHNRNILSFKNGSRFRYLIAGTAENRRGGLGRSGSTNYLHATEAAFYGDEEGLRAFRSSTSSIYPYRLQIYESTANGFNHFEEAYSAAKTSAGMRAIFVGWWRDERNVFAADHPLYQAYAPDRKLNRWERTRVNAVKREYDFDITMGQIAWYRWKLAEDFNNDESTALQELPWTDEDAFQASGAKYFTSESLTEAIKAAKQTPFLSYRYRLGMRFEETVVVAEPRQAVAELRIWEQSSRFGHYVIGCDPAYGSSDRADRTVISVWRAYADHLVQVAEFATPQVSTYQCAWVLAHLGGFYGQLDCRVNLEITGPGTAVFQELQQLKMRLNDMRPADGGAELRNVFKHMRDYMFRKADSLDSGLAYHWKMTDDLKRRVMAQLKDAIELRRMIPRSVHLLEECRHIVNDDGSIEAEGGYKDDRVVAAALAHEAWRMWLVQPLRAQRLTLERARQQEATGGDKPIDIHIRDYLKAQKISDGVPSRIVQPYERGRA
ncbi:MAG TPA: hypothetical protein VF772_11925, partial [Terriglobales bacterium]